MSRRPLGHGPLKNMGNFKAEQVDYAYYLTLSDEPMAVCLTERQMYILTVQNTYTYWGTRWYNTDDVSEAQLKLIAAEIEDLLMCGCGTPEPSITDRFTSNTYMTTTNEFYETTYNTWNDNDQTVFSIAPKLDWITGNHGDINKIICTNISILLQTIIESAIAYKRQTTQEKKDITKNLAAVFAALATAGGAAIASGGILAAGMAFLGGPLTVFGLAMAAVGLAIANIVEMTDLSVLQDAEAIEMVRCVLAQNLPGEQLTRERFMAGLTPNDFPTGSNAEKLAAIVQPYLNDLNVYLQFLVSGNGLYDAVDIGAMPDCDTCIPPETCVVFTNPGDGGNWASAENPASYLWAQHFNTHGWSSSHGGMTITDPVTNTTFWIEPYMHVLNNLSYVRLTFSGSVSGVTLKTSYASGGTTIATSGTSGTVHTFTGLSTGTDSLSVYIAGYPDAVYLEEICYY